MKFIDPNLKFTKPFTYTNKPRKIFIHHALKKSCTIQDVHRWHLEKGWVGCGYHFFIDKNGNIFIGRPLNAQGAHVKGENNNSVGICVEGCYQDYKMETDLEMPEEQFFALVELAKRLMKEYSIPEEEVLRHHDVAVWKLCPGNYFPWEGFKQELNKDRALEGKADLDHVIDRIILELEVLKKLLK